MKRIASIQDFSCLGKCSQAVALPVLSAMGLECAALPTALLSAHTAFDGFVSYDLTPQLPPMVRHWQQLGLQFDAIYTGYLGSAEQIALVLRFFDEFPAPLRFVDPVMGDHGRLYAGFSADFPAQLRRLCGRADVITPNVTEACLLTGQPYRPMQTQDEVRALLEGLLALGARNAVVTGVRLDEKTMAVAAMQAGERRLWLHPTPYFAAVFHGAGDLFAATAAGALTLGRPLLEALALAADYTALTLRTTLDDSERRWYGVNFETTLPELMRRLSLLPRPEDEL